MESSWVETIWFMYSIELNVRDSRLKQFEEATMKYSQLIIKTYK